MFQKLRSAYYKTIYGIQNIFIWLPVIWRDRDWDGHYVYEILYKKIADMEKHHQKYNPFVNKEKTLKRLRIARLLLKRITEHEYFENSLLPVERKYGDWPLETDPFFEPEPTEHGTYRLFDGRSKEHEAAWSRAMYHSMYMEKQDKDMLFSLLRKNLDRWWT